MEVFGRIDLRRQGTRGGVVAEVFERLGVFAQEVARLYHELVDDAVEEHTAVSSAADEGDEVVAMDRRLVEKLYRHFAPRCFDQDATACFAGLCRSRTAGYEYK